MISGNRNYNHLSDLRLRGGQPCWLLQNDELAGLHGPRWQLWSRSVKLGGALCTKLREKCAPERSAALETCFTRPARVTAGAAAVAASDGTAGIIEKRTEMRGVQGV